MGGRVVDDHVGLAEGDVTALDTSGGLDGGAFDVVPDVPESPAGLAGQVEPAVLPLLSIVVPAYNEALMIMGSLTTLYAYLQDLSDRYRFELIVVDDGSTDETPAIAEAFASTRPEVRVLRHPVNFRLGQALRYGISQSKGDYVVTFDSDLTYSPDHIERLVEALREQHARICVASPYMKGGRNSGLPWNRKMMSKSVNKLLAASSQHEVSTVTGLVRAYDGPFIRGLNLKSMGPEINTEILYKAQILRARVIEIPAHLDWTGQTERMNARKVSLKVSSTSKLLMFSSFLFRPITFFLVPGLILLAISVYSLGALAWTVVQGYGDASGEQLRRAAHRRLRRRLGAAPALVHHRRPHLRGGRPAREPRGAGGAGEAILRGPLPHRVPRPPAGRAGRRASPHSRIGRGHDGSHNVRGRAGPMSSSTLDDSVTAPEQGAAPGATSPAERTRSLVLIGLLTIAGAILWTWELGSKSLYRDEAFTASTVLRPWRRPPQLLDRARGQRSPARRARCGLLPSSATARPPSGRCPSSRWPPSCPRSPRWPGGCCHRGWPCWPAPSSW